MKKLPKWLIPFNTWCLLLLIAGMGTHVMSAQIAEPQTLEYLIGKAVRAHAWNDKKEVFRRQKEEKLNQIHRSRWPGIDWNTQGTYQSDNVHFALPLPQLEPIDLPLYKFQSALESHYALYDGGVTAALKGQAELQEQLDRAGVETALFAIRDRVVELYFNALKLSLQIELIDSSFTLFEAQETKLRSAISNGVALPSDIQRIEMEKLNLESKKMLLKSKREALLSALSALTRTKVTSHTLQIPEKPQPHSAAYYRPEFELFYTKKQYIAQAADLIDAKRKPQVLLFAKAGVGAPNPVNFFDEDFAPFGIVGASLHWTLVDWRKSKSDKALLSVKEALVDVEQKALEDQLLVEEKRLLAALAGLSRQDSLDAQMIKLQDRIVATTQRQYQEGVRTLPELISAIHKRTALRLAKEMHRLDRRHLEYKINALYSKLF